MTCSNGVELLQKIQRINIFGYFSFNLHVQTSGYICLPQKEYKYINNNPVILHCVPRIMKLFPIFILVKVIESIPYNKTPNEKLQISESALILGSFDSIYVDFAITFDVMVSVELAAVRK